MSLIMSVFLLRYRGIPSGSLGFQRNHFVTPCESRKKRIQLRLHPLFLFKRFIRFFFKMAMQRMQEEMKQKEANTKRFSTFVF